MKSIICFCASFSVALPALAATKHLECLQRNNEGSAQLVRATIDDDSENAEVQRHPLDADCNSSDACATEIYEKTVLPSVIRLSNFKGAPGMTYSVVIDIDRTNLKIITRSSLSSTVTSSFSSEYHGSCELKKMEKSKKLL